MVPLSRWPLHFHGFARQAGQALMARRLRVHPSLLKRPDDERIQGKEWAQIVLERARLRVVPAENVLHGATAICRYMKISHLGTLKRWVIQYGFPAFRDPNGIWVSSCTAIDEWIWLASELERDGQLAAGAAKAAKRAAGLGQSSGRVGTKPYSSSLHDREGTAVATVTAMINTRKREKHFGRD
jgi:hypothetical protein